MKDQLTTIHDLNEQFQQHGIETIKEDILITIEERVNNSIVSFDYRNYYNIQVNFLIVTNFHSVTRGLIR
uniref:Uncharacterized protein n=1 Tax=Acrobeloides nanus TaxID=290746 RepID=A0A914E628_9BILA